MPKTKNVLVIEDEPNIRSLFTRELKESGYHVFAEASGRKSLELMKNHNIDIAILDILLPEKNGLEIYDEIRKQFPQTKIIISSVHSPSEQKFLISDADDYYHKSESISLLIDRINKISGG